MNRKLYICTDYLKEHVFMTFNSEEGESGWWISEEHEDTWEEYYNNTEKHTKQTLSRHAFTLIAPTVVMEWQENENP